MTAVIIVILTVLVMGLVLIGNAYDRRQMKVTKTSSRKWSVDKQVIAKPDSNGAGSAASRELELYNIGLRALPELPSLDIPRIVRVTISNRVQIALIGEASLRDEDTITDLIAEGEERCSFLNAHDVK